MRPLKRTALGVLVGALSLTGVACGGGSEASLDEVAADVRGRITTAGLNICSEEQEGKITGLTFVFRVVEMGSVYNTDRCTTTRDAYVQVYDADNGDLGSERVTVIDGAAINVDWGQDVVNLRDKLLDALA